MGDGFWIVRVLELVCACALLDNVRQAWYVCLMHATTYTIGQRVRTTSPNWDRPGLIAYTIKTIDAEHGTVTLSPPRIPGLSAECPTYPLAEIVPA